MKKIHVRQLRTSGLSISETVTTNDVELLYRLAQNTDDASLGFASISVNKAYEDAVDYLETNTGLNIDVTNYEYFRFQDTSVEAICSSLWGDNIGLSYDQAAGVTSSVFGTTFTNNDNITKFNEFYNFIGMTSVPGTSEQDGAFANCDSLQEITLPLTSTFIGQYAFANDASLTTVGNTSFATTINSYAFKDCRSLKGTCFNNAITLGSYVFENCESLDASIVMNSLTTIGKGAYRYSGLTEFDAPMLASLPAGDSSYNGVFSKCGKLKTVKLPNIETIGAYTFCDASTLKSFTGTPEQIGGHSFENCSSLESIELKNLDALTTEANFKNCTSLKSLGKGLCDVDGSVGQYNFYGCKSLVDVSLGSGITEIGEHCFEGDSSLTTVDFQGAPCIIKPYAFADCSCLCNLQAVNNIKRIEYNSFKNNNIELNLGELNSFLSLEYFECGDATLNNIIVENLSQVKIVNCDRYKVSWNQLVQNGNFKEGLKNGKLKNWFRDYWECSEQIIHDDGTLTISGNKMINRIVSAPKFSFKGADYIFCAVNVVSINSGEWGIGQSTASGSFSVPILKPGYFSTIIEFPKGWSIVGNSSWQITTPTNISGSIRIKYAYMINLSQLFGQGNEPNSIEQFEQWLVENNINPDEYKTFDLGTIKYLTKPSWLL